MNPSAYIPPTPASPDHQGHILWTPAKVQLLRSRLTAAKEKQETKITFEGKTILVAYGVYLLDYLEHEFASKTPSH